jgi:hypothetical protein
MCRECENSGRDARGRYVGPSPLIELALRRDGSQGGVELRGVVTCLHDKHRWPVLIKDNVVVETRLTLPAAHSKRLFNVPDGIVQDIEEAELAHFNQCYKASVVMCRRALQLALEKRLGLGENKQTLGPLLDMVRKGNNTILDSRHMALAERIKEYGDSGAHRVGDFTSDTVGVIVHDTVEVLNYLCSTGA